MNIELRITNSNPSTYLLQFIEKLLNHCLKKMGLSSKDIGRVIFADQDHYATAIKDISGHMSYTNDVDYISVGKTVSKRLNSGHILSDITLRSGIIDKIVGGVLNNCDISRWDESEQQALYTIYHELGHCKDGKIRQDITTPHIVNSTNKFKIRQICDYYRHILLGELSASVHSGLFMTAKVFERKLSDTILKIEKKLTYIDELMDKYSKDHSILYELAFTVGGLFWFILIQYSKLIGTRISNKRLRDHELILWKEASTSAYSIILEYDRLISSAWCVYPNWDSNLFHDLDSTWESLSLSFGYKFVHSDQGDALYWQ